MKFKSNFLCILLMDIFWVVIVRFAVVCGRDSIAVVAEMVEGCGDGSSTISIGSGFRKECVNCALIEGVYCAS